MAGYTGGGGISGAGSGHPGTISIWDALIIHDMLSVDRPIRWRFRDVIDSEIPDMGTGGIGGPGIAGEGPDCEPIVIFLRAHHLGCHLLDIVMSA